MSSEGGALAAVRSLEAVAAAGGMETLSEQERTEAMAAACSVLLCGIGEDTGREGLVKTPMRMARALLELTRGYKADAGSILSGALFEVDGGGGVVVVKDIEFSSLCEHHVLPFFGSVHIGYLPGARVVGLSKLARVVAVFAARLQVQERLTRQVAEAVLEHVGAKGVVVMVEAEHMCMGMRGARKPGSSTVTMVRLGAFLEDESLMDEFRMQMGLRGGGGRASGRGR